MENLPDPDMSSVNQIIGEDMKNINALHESALRQKKQEIENKYAPQTNEADIAYKQAQTAYQKTQNALYPQKTQSEINYQNALMRQIDQKLKDPLLGGTGIGSNEANLAWTANRFGKNSPEYAMALNDYKQSLASEAAKTSYYQSGGPRGGGVDQKALAGFSGQLAMDHPDWTPEQINDASNQYLAGETTFSNGETLPPLGGKASQFITSIQNRNAPVAVKNQAANLDVLVNDLNDFDIDAVSRFTGPQGKARLIEAKAQMVANPDDPNIDPAARRYLSAMNEMILNMDSMRKAFGTSVVPDYVYNTIGKLANPNNSIWNDKTQVLQSFNDIKKTMTKNRNSYFEKVKHGVTARSPEENKTIKWKMVGGNLVRAD